MLFGRRELLTGEQLKRLSQHKYSCQCSTLLDPYMQPWWNWLVRFCPLWVAPNLITLVGLIANVVSTLVMLAFSTNAAELVPRWTCVLVAFGLFVYQSLDAIDGKQARRTASSSPLGELFDHGCDAVSIVFVAIGFCTVMSLGEYPMWMFSVCFVAVCLFYSAHWQTFVSGTQKFGLIDVTEEQWAVIALHLIGAICGPEIYNVEVLGVKLKLVPVYFAFVPVILHALGTIQSILKGGVGKNGSSVADTSVLSPSIPLALVIVPAYVICQKSTQHIFQQHPVLYVFAFSMVASKVTCKLVLAHMCRSELEYMDSCMVGPVMLFLNQYFNTYFDEYWVLWVCMVWATVDLIDYSHKVCRQICNHLSIHCFSIARRTGHSVAARSTSGVQTRAQRHKAP